MLDCLGCCSALLHIGNLMRRWRQTGEVKDRPRSGRPRTTSAAEDQQIGLMALRRRATPVLEIRVNIRASRRNGQQGLSVQTVRNRLREQGLRSRKPAKSQSQTTAFSMVEKTCTVDSCTVV